MSTARERAIRELEAFFLSFENCTTEQIVSALESAGLVVVDRKHLRRVIQTLVRRGFERADDFESRLDYLDLQHEQDLGYLQAKEKELAEERSKTDRLQRELAEAVRGREFTTQWYAERFERLRVWAHERLTDEQRTQYFNIVANGTELIHEPPTYAQQLNMAKYRAEKAEAELDEARQQACAALKAVESAIDVDCSGLASSLNEVRDAVRSRSWIVDGRGSYEWDDDRYRDEAHQAFDEVLQIVERGLRESGDRVREHVQTVRAKTERCGEHCRELSRAREQRDEYARGFDAAIRERDEARRDRDAARIIANPMSAFGPEEPVKSVRLSLPSFDGHEMQPLVDVPSKEEER